MSILERCPSYRESKGVKKEGTNSRCLLRESWLYSNCAKEDHVAANILFSFVSNLLAYITIPKNIGKKITWDKKLTTVYIIIVENLVYQQIFNSNVAKHYESLVLDVLEKACCNLTSFQVHTAVHLSVVNRT